MKKSSEKSNLEMLRKELNDLIKKNDGKITQEIIEISQKLDEVIVECVRNNT
ncbi:aspartyl-phosphate phosphatase Spo0E family protein [Serpentinicella sp. ANB-PHB4]|uniref:aspartyl-phosphate phosphatase Spo0E family protein n=1 Tax=Serpentinicella sp. ANB-PHB4 TaxID=3074076 RepID=UPI00285B88F9|nr:aspartyl-phosphate phosphatase Spo0E family protein [Serpentinicella sp. ANB-PHB4]MDR5659430.1 aspartyl-phosphate phosphatase Spo0E family protein [Serpentinicella sp. ANB-PHB4]